MESLIHLQKSLVIFSIFLLCSGKPSQQFHFLKKTDVDMAATRAAESEASQRTSMEVVVKEPLWTMYVPWWTEREPEPVASGEAIVNLEEQLPFNPNLEEAIRKNFTDMDFNMTNVIIEMDDYMNMVELIPQFIIKVSLQIIPTKSFPSENPSNGSSVDSNRNGSIGIEPLFNNTDGSDTLSDNVITSFIVLACLGGLMGNGVVIWLLGFQMRRNAFTTYILNLSIADFASLFCLLGTAILTVGINLFTHRNTPGVVFLISFELFFFTYSAGQFLLAAISIDRCVAVLFPLWHRCHRPPYLSALVSALIWLLSSLLSVVHFTLHVLLSVGLVFQLIVNVCVCTPLMLISTLTLFIYICSKGKQRHQGKLVTVILLALLVFLILSLPLNVTYIIHSHIAPQPKPLLLGLACSSLNSSLNPLIYFLIGRTPKKDPLRTCLKVALQRVFKDEEDSLGERNTQSEMHTLFSEVKTEALHKQSI